MNMNANRWMQMTMGMAMAITAQATDITWLGNDGDLLAPANWSGGVLPTTNEVAVFSPSAPCAITASADFAVGGMWFSPTCYGADINLGGHTLLTTNLTSTPFQVDGRGTVSVRNGTLTIGNDFYMSNYGPAKTPRTFELTGEGTVMNVGGSVSVGLLYGNNTLMVNTGATLNVNGTVSLSERNYSPDAYQQTNSLIRVNGGILKAHTAAVANDWTYSFGVGRYYGYDQTLVVENGGVVDGNSGILQVGSQLLSGASNCTLMVRDGGLVTNVVLQYGRSLNNYCCITNGGIVATKNSYLNSVLNQTVTLDVFNGGLFTSPNVITLGSDLARTGTFHLVVHKGGTLKVASLYLTPWINVSQNIKMGVDGQKVTVDGGSCDVGNLQIGQTTSSNSFSILNGGICTNRAGGGRWRIGGYEDNPRYAYGNRMILSNGTLGVASTVIFVGAGAGATNNSLSLSAGSLMQCNNLQIGVNGGSENWMEVENSTFSGNIIMGNGDAAMNNELRIRGTNALVSCGALTINHGALLDFAIPAKGYASAPIRASGLSASSDGWRLKVTAEALQKAHNTADPVPLLHVTGTGTIPYSLLTSADLPTGATLSLSTDSRILYAKIPSTDGTVIRLGD